MVNISIAVHTLSTAGSYTTHGWMYWNDEEESVVIFIQKTIPTTERQPNLAYIFEGPFFVVAHTDLDFKGSLKKNLHVGWRACILKT